MLKEEPAISRNRLEALVDAIFAFAMTLLVTGLVIPSLPGAEARTELPARIAAMRPEFFSFLIAFFILASFWLAHHRQFRYVRTADRAVVRLNLCILACVVLVPFTTNLSGDYNTVQIAVDLFHLNLFALGLFFLLQWWYLVRTPAVTEEAISRPESRRGMRRALLVPVVSALGFIISFADPSLSTAVYLFLIPGFYLITASSDGN